MTTYSSAFDVDRSASSNAREVLIGEVQRGLLRRPRSLAPWMFYDAAARGFSSASHSCRSTIPTRAERNILTSFAERNHRCRMDCKSQAVRLLELGAGTASKTDVLLDATARMRRWRCFTYRWMYRPKLWIWPAKESLPGYLRFV